MMDREREAELLNRLARLELERHWLERWGTELHEFGGELVRAVELLVSGVLHGKPAGEMQGEIMGINGLLDRWERHFEDGRGGGK